MRKKTVQKWYAVLVSFAILLSSTVVGAFGIVTLWNKTNRDVVTVMNLTTEAKANEMDLVLLKIRDAVDTVAAYVGARVATSSQQLDKELSEEDLDDEFHELFQSTLGTLEGAVGYYIRFAEPYDSAVGWFAYRKNDVTGEFTAVTDGDELWRQDAESEAGDWYELAKESGVPVWIPIRECTYMDCYIFSYAVPVYFNDQMVGVACVDVDFEVLAKPVREVSIYENGYSYLTDDKGRVCYHPKIGYGVLLTEDDDDVPEVDEALADTSTHGKLISYEYQGQKKEMTFKSLINDMRLVVTANKEDIEHETVMLIRIIILVSIVILVLVLLLALHMEKRTMHPVLDNMDDLAHLDGLTGLQNRTSFLEMQSDLNRRIREGESDFGFVMFDANNLKRINDQYGHKYGDIYLLRLVEMIQFSFPGHQGYRIGGDEFVVLIEGASFAKEAEKCMKNAENWQKKREKESLDPWEKPSAASAFAGFDPQVHNNAEAVLAEADAAMYKNKEQMKRENGNS